MSACPREIGAEVLKFDVPVPARSTAAQPVPSMVMWVLLAGDGQPPEVVQVTASPVPIEVAGAPETDADRVPRTGGLTVKLPALSNTNWLRNTPDWLAPVASWQVTVTS